MTPSDVTLWLVYLTAPGQTLFVLLYGLRSPWWHALIGKALLTKAVALMLLIDLAVVQDQYGQVIPHLDWVTLGIMILIFIGAYMQLAAWIMDRIHVWRHGSPSQFAPDSADQSSSAT